VGGMRAKLRAARIAMRLGIPLLIVSGHEKDILKKALRGEDVGTLFWAAKSAKNARQKWIAFSAARKGNLVVDVGAYEALKSKKRSLLPGGILKTKGLFERGDVLELETPEGTVFGRGVTRYSSYELDRIAGKKTHQIEKILGYKYQDEVIHRNDLVIWS
jgi:glutamate 5-kinase